jgi:hypothetical protein
MLNIPKDDFVIWKYMTFDKFLLLLLRKELYFKRADAYPEYFEGHLTINEKQNLIDIFKKQNISKHKSEVNKVFKALKKYCESTYIDCWHNNQGESYAMWKIFGESKNCIALKTTVGKLRALYDKAKDFIKITPYLVDYYDSENADNYPYSSKYIFIRKPFYFYYEAEIRGLIQLEVKGFGEKFPNDIRLPIIPTDLIESIWISPFSEVWFEQLVQDLLNRLKIKIEINMSKMKKS